MVIYRTYLELTKLEMEELQKHVTNHIDTVKSMRQNKSLVINETLLRGFQEIQESMKKTNDYYFGKAKIT